MATILGSRNADRLSARNVNDVVEGLGGNDTLSSMGLTGISLFGGDGSDTLIAKASDTLIDGGAGVDTVQFAAAVASGSGVGQLADSDLEGVEKVVITNTSAAAYDFSSQSEALNITGGRAVDNITGGAGNDTITGGLGADSLVGGAGDDVIVAEASDAKIDGTSGNDTVRFAGAVLRSAAGVYDLTNAELVNIGNVEITNTGNAEYNFGDQSEALNITGGRGKDTITGGTAADTLRGGNGNDTLIAVGTAGANQDALVDGGAGNDTVKYAAAVGSLDDAKLTNVEYVVITNTAGATYDFSSQTEGLDITGTGFADVIYGGSGADALRGGLGGDTLHAGDNDKLIDGGNGADTAVFAASVSAKNLLDGDLINVETISITGTGSYDFSAQSEKLAITATGGAVTITGGKGVDTLTGGTGDDVIVASDLDVINGGGGTNDTVRFAAAVSATNLTNDDLRYVENIVITNSKAATYDFSAQVGEAFNITGGSGNDTIKTATSTVDTINAGAGNDVLVAEDTDALIDGGTGTDTVQFAAAVLATNLLDEELANVENVVITNTANATYDFTVQTESLQITGNSANDIIKGGYRADTIIGGEGADELSGNEGTDILIAEGYDANANGTVDSSAGDAFDTLIDGGAGDDTVRFAAAVRLSDGDLVNVENVVITNTGNAAYDFSLQGTTAGVTENLNITGGSGSDTITGGADADTLNGGAGNDVLAAAENDALIDGGAGTDTVKFGADVTTALTNAELVNVERVEITNTSTTLAGTYNFSEQTEGLTILGSDYFVTTSGATQYDSDTITGGSGNDSISGGNGDDLLTGGAGADTLLGGDLSDTLVGGLGADSLLGGDGNDRLEAQDTDAKIDGGANTLVSAGGGDTAVFATGVSATNLTDAKLVEIERVLIENDDTDAAYNFSAQSEALIITGNIKADTITGTQDWDSIDGAAGNDVLSGGAGNDTLKGNTGNDTLAGGAGYDVYQVDLGTDTITDLAAGETLTVSSGATAVVASGLLDLTQLAVATSNSGTVNITGTLNADVIKGTTTTGVDVITGGVGADTMSGISGNDRFVIAAGDSVFTNGTAAESNSAALDKVIDFSSDLIVISGAITDTLFSVAGNVFVGIGAGGADDNQDNVNDFVATTYLVDLDGTVTTFELGLDVTTNGTGAAFANSSAAQLATVLNVTGTSGIDAITGGVNADTISGGEGADVITGDAGADVITGGEGADVITGGVGADTMYGSSGNDSFVITAGDSVFTNGVAATQGDSAASDVITDFSITDDLIVITGAITDTSFSVAGNVFMGIGGATTGTDYQDNINDFTTSTYLVDLDGTGTTFELGLDVGVITESNAESRTVLNVTGTTGADKITGGVNADTISGGANADTISGGEGADSLDGGSESDLFIVASATDGGVGETYAGGADTDTLRVTGTTALNLSDDTLSAIEALDLTLDASGSVASDDQVLQLNDTQVDALSAIDASGGDRIELQDVMTSDMLDGTVVNGTLTLKLKDVAGNALTLVEGVMDAAGDLLKVDGSGLTGTNALTFTGTAETTAKVSVTGGAGADLLTGTSGADTLNGGAGADNITLGAGADVLVLNQTATADTITDYLVADDVIQLSKAAYATLAANVGDLTLGAEFTTVANAAALTGGSVAASTDAQDFIFLQDTGALYYNADAATAGGLVLVGTFQGGALLVATEFTIIA